MLFSSSTKGKNLKNTRNNKHYREAPAHNTSVWLYGRHAVLAALSNPNRKKQKLFVTAKPEFDTDSVPVQVVNKGQLEQLLPEGAVHQGLALKADALPSVALEDIAFKDKAVVLVLDQVVDPRNIGAILRSAAAFDAAAVVVAAAHAPTETGALAKAACGALEVVPFVRVNNLSRALETLKKKGFWIYGLDGYATATLSEEKLPPKTAFVLGSEGDGMRRLTSKNCDYTIKLPMSDKVESLNVSNAAAIALYEFYRTK